MSLFRRHPAMTNSWFTYLLLFIATVGFASSISAAPRLADGFRYPVGNITPGFVTPAQDNIDRFYNSLDFAASGTGTLADTLHSGEDWQQNDNASAPSAVVRSIAAGDIVAVSVQQGLMLVRHQVPAGTFAGRADSPRLANAQELYSVYSNIDPVAISFNSQTNMATAPIAVRRGEVLGTIDIQNAPQLHIELRTLEPEFDTLYDNAVSSDGFYSNQAALDAEGLIDPSDFIDGHRSIDIVRGPQLYIHDSRRALAQVDVRTGNLVGLSNLGRTLTDIAFSPAGELYGMDFSTLFRIDLATGSLSTVGSHGVPGGNALVFSAEGELYAAGNSSTSLYQLDPITGTGTVIGDTGVSSSGDLAFYQGELYLSGFGVFGATSDVLVKLQLTPTVVPVTVGEIGFQAVFGLATAADGKLYGTAGTVVLEIDPATGAGTEVVDYEGQGLATSNGSSFFVEAGAPTTLLASSVLPTSRSVGVRDPATAFVSVINGGSTAARNCVIAPRSDLNGEFDFQATDPATNAPVGERNAPVDIAAGAVSTFVVFLESFAEREADEFVFNIGCENTELANPTAGLNTLLFSASTTPSPDVVALVATPTNDGVVNVNLTTGSAAFALASVNVGTSDDVQVTLDTGAANDLPLLLNLCETDSVGQCLNGGPTSSIQTTINSDATPTFSIFVTATEAIDFRPDRNRVYIRFRDSNGDIRGSTSVAVRTQ